MDKVFFIILLMLPFLFSCSGDEPDMSSNFAEEIIGGWQLEKIRVEGADCQILFGADVPAEYLADEEGCAVPEEILGNSKRCVNVEFMANGEGVFFWSEISSQLDAPITYEILDDEVRYCFVGSSCSGYYKLVGSKLETVSELRLDDECNSVFVLRRK